MGRFCTICSHPERAEIDRLLVEGTAYRELTKRFGNSRAALSRHRNGHIPAALVKAREAAEVGQGIDLFGQMIDLNERTQRILAHAEASNDPRLALSAIKEARGNLELLCKAMCSQMPKQSGGGYAGSGYRNGSMGNGYENGHPAPDKERPDLSFLSDDELAQLRGLCRLAYERECLAYQQLREGSPN